MYVLHPPPGWKELKRTTPPNLLDQNGDPVKELEPPNGVQEPRTLRDIPLLPLVSYLYTNFPIHRPTASQRIGTQEEEWYFEAIRRLDPRIRWEDVTMRMSKRDRGTGNCIQWRASRGWREAMGMLSWHLTSKKGNDRLANDRILGRLNEWQKQNNTTRGLTPGRINPTLPRAPGNWVDWPKSKSGKDWGIAQTVKFSDKKRKKSGPKKKKAEKPDGSGQTTKKRSKTGKSVNGQVVVGEDSAAQAGVQHTRPINQPRSRVPTVAAGRAVVHIHRQHGLGSGLSQQHIAQATPDGTFGVLKPDNTYKFQNAPSATTSARPQTGFTQRLPTSLNRSYQGEPESLNASASAAGRTRKRHIEELEMADEMPLQHQAKRPKDQSSATEMANTPNIEYPPHFENGMAWYNWYIARHGLNPDGSTKAVDASATSSAAATPGLASRRIPGGSMAQTTDSSNLHEDPSARMQHRQDRQGAMTTSSVVPLTTAAYGSSNSRSRPTSSGALPAHRTPSGPQPSLVGTKRRFETFDGDAIPLPGDPAKKPRQSSPRESSHVQTSSAAKAVVFDHIPSQGGHANGLVSQQQHEMPQSNSASHHTSPATVTSSSLRGNGSSSPVLTPRSSVSSSHVLPGSASNLDLDGPTTMDQQVPIDPQARPNNTTALINDVSLIDSLPTNATLPAGHCTSPLQTPPSADDMLDTSIAPSSMMLPDLENIGMGLFTEYLESQWQDFAPLDFDGEDASWSLFP